jgi:TP901 family phage tail tape measure protein
VASNATVGILRVLLTANTAEFDSAMKRVSASAGVLAKDLGQIGRQATQLGSALTKTLTVPIVGVAAAAIKTGVEFDSVMNSIQGVLRPTAAQMEQVRVTAIKMGADTAFSATDAATAMLELGKAGFTTAQSIQAVPKVLELAAASGLSMGESAELAARALAAFGLETADLGHVNDVLAKAVNSSTLEITDLQTAFKYVGPIAQGFGVSIEQASAALAVMRDNGIAAETSGRALREGLSRLANPVKAVHEVLAELGVDLKQVDPELVSLSDIVGTLQSKGLTAAQSLKLFGDAAGPGMLALVSKGREGLDSLTKSLENSEGAAKAMADAMMQGLPGAMERLKGSVETALLSISKAIEPAVMAILGIAERLADLVTKVLVPAFTMLPQPVQAVALGLVGLAAVAGPLLFVFGQLALSGKALAEVFVAKGIATKALTALFPALTTAIGVNTTATTVATVATTQLTIAQRAALLASAAWAPGMAVVTAAAARLSGALGLTTLATNASAFASRAAASAKAFFGAALLATSINANALLARLGATTVAQYASATASRVAALAAGSLGVAMSTLLVASTLTGLFVALGAAVYQVGKAAVGLWAAIREGRGWEFITARDEQNFIRRWLGMSKTATDAADEIRRAMERARMVDEIKGTTLANNMKELSEQTLAFAKAGELTTPMMKRIAAAAEQMKAQHIELSPVLQNIVDAYGREAVAARNAATAIQNKTQTDATYAQQLAKVREVIAGFSTEQRANIIAGDKMGESNENLAKSLNLTGDKAGLAEAAVKLFLESLQSSGRTAEQIAEGPFKKLANRIIELDAQLRAAEKEGPKAYALAIQELGDDLVETDTKARMLGGTLTNTVAKAASIAAAKMRDEWSRAIKDMELLPGGVEAGPDTGAARFEQERDLQKRRLDIIRRTEEQTRALQGDTLQSRLQQLETERMAQIETARSQGDFTQQTLDLINNLHRQSVVRVITDWRDGLQQIPTLAQQFFSAIPNLIQQALTGGGGLTGGIKAIFSNLGATIGGQLFEAGGLLNSLGNSLTKMMTRVFGESIGNALGLALPGIGQALGALLGPLIEKVGSAIGKGLDKIRELPQAAKIAITAIFPLVGLFAFGVSGAVKKAREEVKAFQKTIAESATEAERAEAALSGWADRGALDVIRVRNAYLATGRTAAEAEAIVRQLWDTDHPDRARAAIEQINTVLAEQAKLLEQNRVEATGLFDDLIEASNETGERIPAAFIPGIERLREMGILTDEQAAKLRGLAEEGSFDLKQLEQDAESLGIEFNALGPKFRNARLGASFEDLYIKMRRLIAAGGDMGTILVGSKDDISALVQEAKAFGASVPEQFRPWIQELLRTGQLVDENGEALKDLAGVNFGDPIVTAMDRMIGKLEEFINKLTGGLYPALENIPTPNINLPTLPNRPAPGVQPPDVNRPFEDIEAGAMAAQRAVDGLNFGSSPGGLKEIPILLALSTRAAIAFAKEAVANIGHVKAAADDLGMSRATAVWGKSANDLVAAIRKIDAARSEMLDRQLTKEEQARANALDREWDFLQLRLTLRKRMDAIDAERNKLLGRELSKQEQQRANELDRHWDALRARWFGAQTDLGDLLKTTAFTPVAGGKQPVISMDAATKQVNALFKKHGFGDATKEHLAQLEQAFGKTPRTQANIDAFLRSLEQTYLLSKQSQLAGVNAFAEIGKAAGKAHGHVDALNFGKSPGGLKEIPIQLGLASDAVRAFQGVALQSFRVVKDWADQALALNVPEFQTPSRLPMLAVPEIPDVRVHVSTAAFNPTDLQREGGPQAVGREIHNHPVIVVDKSGRSLDDVTSEVERRIAERDLAGNALGLRDAFEAIAENVVDRRLARAF